MNKDSYLILETLPAEYDSRVKAMEVDERPTEQYSDIGGLDKQIQEVQTCLQHLRNTTHHKCLFASQWADWRLRSAQCLGLVGAYYKGKETGSDVYYMYFKYSKKLFTFKTY